MFLARVIITLHGRTRYEPKLLKSEVWGLGVLVYLNPKSMLNNSPKPIITTTKAIILHTFGCPGRVHGLALLDPRLPPSMVICQGDSPPTHTDLQEDSSSSSLEP